MLIRASLEGWVQCRVCHQYARLDMISRWMVSCMLSLIMPSLLLYGGVFYSGHFFIITMFMVIAGWRIVCMVGLPLFGLERVTRRASFDRNEAMLIVGVLTAAALVMDIYMAYRIDKDSAFEAKRAAAVQSAH